MSEAEAKLVALRASFARAERHNFNSPMRVPLGHGAIDACLQGGLLRGALHEIFAEAGHETVATGFVAALCGRVAVKKPVLWIRPDFSALECGELAASGWLELGLDPAQLLLLRVGDATSLLRAGNDALGCGALGAVVMEIPDTPKSLTLVASQRLTLESARKGVTAFLLRFNAAPQTSTAETRWHLKALPSPRKSLLWGCPAFDAHLARNRHGRTGRFALQWSSDHGLFQPACGTQDPGIMVPPSCNRPAASAGESAGPRSL